MWPAYPLAGAEDVLSKPERGAHGLRVGGLMRGLIRGLVAGLMRGLIRGLVGGLMRGLVGRLMRGLMDGLMRGLMGGPKEGRQADQPGKAYHAVFIGGGRPVKGGIILLHISYGYEFNCILIRLVLSVSFICKFRKS